MNLDHLLRVRDQRIKPRRKYDIRNNLKALMKGTHDEKVAKMAEQGLEIKEDLERKGMLSQRTRTSSALYLNKMAQGMDTQHIPVSHFQRISRFRTLII